MPKPLASVALSSHGFASTAHPIHLIFFAVCPSIDESGILRTHARTHIISHIAHVCFVAKISMIHEPVRCHSDAAILHNCTLCVRMTMSMYAKICFGIIQFFGRNIFLFFCLRGFTPQTAYCTRISIINNGKPSGC